jgi:hypothetical protein
MKNNMSKIKETKLNNLNKSEMQEAIYEIPPMEYFDLMDEYKNGRYSHLNPESENYDENFDKANANYSELTIEDGFDWAFSTMQVTEEEVGKDVYAKLLKEQLLAYIRSNRI